METRNEIRPYLPQHPGYILKAELKERGIKQKNFAEMIGMRPSHLSALLHGGRNISPQLSKRLETVLGTPASVWLQLQNNYNLDMLRPSEVVAGYNPPQKPVLALAEPSSEEKGIWDVAFHAGQKDIVKKIQDCIPGLGLSEIQKKELSIILSISPGML